MMETVSSQDAATEEAQEPEARLAGAQLAHMVLGQMCWLLAHSPPHRHYFVSDIEWYLLPAIATGQFRLWQQEGQPVGFALWAHVDDEIHGRLKDRLVKIPPGRWAGGRHLWLIDLVAPFGGGDRAFEELCRTTFRYEKFHYFKWDEDAACFVVCAHGNEGVEE